VEIYFFGFGETKEANNGGVYWQGSWFRTITWCTARSLIVIREVSTEKVELLNLEFLTLLNFTKQGMVCLLR
jgi:hypothetical protein